VREGMGGLKATILFTIFYLPYKVNLKGVSTRNCFSENEWKFDYFSYTLLCQKINLGDQHENNYKGKALIVYWLNFVYKIKIIFFSGLHQIVKGVCHFHSLYFLLWNANQPENLMSIQLGQTRIQYKKFLFATLTINKSPAGDIAQKYTIPKATITMLHYLCFQLCFPFLKIYIFYAVRPSNFPSHSS